MDEFFRQGDTEASRGLPISPFMDREKTDIAKCQVGFIKCDPPPPSHLPRTPPIPAPQPRTPAPPIPGPTLSRACRPSVALASSLSRACRSRSILIKPYFEEWGHFLGASGTQLTDNIAANIEKWETEGENALGEERAILIKTKPIPKVVAEVTDAPAASDRERSESNSSGGTPSSPTKRAALLAARVAGMVTTGAPGASPDVSPSKMRTSARS